MMIKRVNVVNEPPSRASTSLGSHQSCTRTCIQFWFDLLFLEVFKYVYHVHICILSVHIYFSIHICIVCHQELGEKLPEHIHCSKKYLLKSLIYPPPTQRSQCQSPSCFSDRYPSSSGSQFHRSICVHSQRELLDPEVMSSIILDSRNRVRSLVAPC